MPPSRIRRVPSWPRPWPSIAAAGAQASVAQRLATSRSSTSRASGTYPLANFSWTLLYQKQPNQAKGVAAGKLFDYVLTTGQGVAAGLGYAPLPASVVALGQQTLGQLQTASGSPLFTS